ncbi:hypothetical protein NSPZN2_100506 [Nitrospira defluvii]|uniref:Uncharacterized protein n=1 Tax=Nitrospira defluvii TaxID=330214 RepID=A0ABM8R5P5_9BACT|nr:hypothetical protein NSPZN2_100506 [Nitrospira defluvii]
MVLPVESGNQCRRLFLCQMVDLGENEVLGQSRFLGFSQNAPFLGLGHLWRCRRVGSGRGGLISLFHGSCRIGGGRRLRCGALGLLRAGSVQGQRLREVVFEDCGGLRVDGRIRVLWFLDFDGTQLAEDLRVELFQLFDVGGGPVEAEGERVMDAGLALVDHVSGDPAEFELDHRKPSDVGIHPVEVGVDVDHAVRAAEVDLIQTGHADPGQHDEQLRALRTLAFLEQFAGAFAWLESEGAFVEALGLFLVPDAFQPMGVPVPSEGLGKNQLRIVGRKHDVQLGGFLPIEFLDLLGHNEVGGFDGIAAALAERSDAQANLADDRVATAVGEAVDARERNEGRGHGDVPPCDGLGTSD